MQVEQVVLLLIVGLLAGIVAGGLGVGGGIVIVPALLFFLGFTQHQAQGTSLAMMLPPIGILAAYNFWRKGHVNIKIALILMVAFVLGGYIGSIISVHIPDKLLRKIFGVFVFLVSLKLIFGK